MTWWNVPEDVWRRVEEAGREERVDVAQLRHVEAKERRVRRFPRPLFLRPTISSTSTVNAGTAVVMGCLMGVAFSPWRVWRTFLMCRGVTRTLRSENICECARMGISSSGGTGVEWMTKACGRGNVPMVKRVRPRKRE